MRGLRIALGAGLALGVLVSTIPAQEPAAPAGPPAAAGQESLVIRWQPWQRETFTLAASLKRPVMLYLRAEDCRLCMQMEDDVLTRRNVVESVAERVVPVLVDADRRPDIASRYVVGALPTVVFLLPNGEPMYKVEDVQSLERVGGYFRAADGLLSYISQVEDYFEARGKDLARKASEVAAVEARLAKIEPGEFPEGRLAEATGRIREGLDFTHGGYGTGWKFILDEPFRLFLLLDAAGADPALAKAVRLTADGMLAGAIHDAVDGGFHHYATTREWGVPALEKRLAANAKALRLLAVAARLDPEQERYREGLRDTAGFMLRVLALADGSLAFSQQGSLGGDDQGSYFQADAAARQSLRPPPLVSRPMTEPMAMAAIGLLEAGAVLADETLDKAALAAVDFLAGKLYEKGRGMARWLDAEGQPRQRGLLADQAAALEAFLAAYAAAGRTADLKRAEELYAFCRQNLSQPAGHYLDRMSDKSAVGLLRRPLVPLDLNGRMALAALRLGAITGQTARLDEARALLGALAPAIPRLDPEDAGLVEALLAASHPAVVVRLGADAGPDLVRAARLLPAAGLTVVREGAGLRGARLCLGSSCSEALADAAALRLSWRGASAGQETAP